MNERDWLRGVDDARLILNLAIGQLARQINDRPGLPLPGEYRALGMLQDALLWLRFEAQAIEDRAVERG